MIDYTLELVFLWAAIDISNDTKIRYIDYCLKYVLFSVGDSDSKPKFQMQFGKVFVGLNARWPRKKIDINIYSRESDCFIFWDLKSEECSCCGLAGGWLV